MKTLTSPFTTEKDKLTGAKPRTLLEIDTSGGTLYYSDQSLTVGAQSYPAKILNWSVIKSQASPGESVIRVSSVKFKLSNAVRIDNQIDIGDRIRVYLWFAGLGSADKLLWFEGNISGGTDWDVYYISFTAEDVGVHFDKLLGNPLIVSTAAKDDKGQMIPVIYGEVENVRCLVKQDGAATTLAGDISDTQTTPIQVTDVSDFPVPGTVIIGEEEITYTSKDIDGNNDHWLGGTIGRGANSTTATSHSKSDAVFQQTSIVFKVADHTVEEIFDIAVLPYGASAKDKVSVGDMVSSIDLNTGEITFDDPISVAKRVAIEVTQQPDQPITVQPIHALDNDPTHNHAITGQTEVTIYGTGVQTQSGVTNPSNSYDQNFDNTFAQIDLAAPGFKNWLGINFSYGSLNGLEIKEAIACVRHSVPTGFPAASIKLKLPGLLGTYLNQNLAQTPTNTIMTQKFSVTHASVINQIDWSKLDNLLVELNGNGSDDCRSLVYQIWWEIKYIPTISNKTLPTGLDTNTVSDLIDEVEIGGDSVAGALGGRLICDVKGIKDDGSGTITGTPNLLIEKPWHVIRHLIENYSNGAVASDIDLAGSFADAAANLPSTYKFGFVIRERINLNRLLALLARQTWCRGRVVAGKYKLDRIKDSSEASAKSLNTNIDSLIINKRMTVKVFKSSNERVVNNVEMQYDLDYSQGYWHQPDAYKEASQASDSASITAYGERTRTYQYFAIRDSAMADDLRDKIIGGWKDPKKEIIFLSHLKHIELEPGDVIALTTSQLGITSQKYEMLEYDYTPPSGRDKRGPRCWLKLMEL